MKSCTAGMKQRGISNTSSRTTSSVECISYDLLSICKTDNFVRCKSKPLKSNCFIGSWGARGLVSACVTKNRAITQTRRRINGLIQDIYTVFSVRVLRGSRVVRRANLFRGAYDSIKLLHVGIPAHNGRQQVVLCCSL